MGTQTETNKVSEPSPFDNVDESTLSIIQKLAGYLADKYVFGYHEVDDIRQEAILIGIEALPRFDPNRGANLETFLYTHMNNRLKTFKRDNYIRQSYHCNHCNNTHTPDDPCEACQKRQWRLEIKRNLIEPIDLNNVADQNETNMAIPGDFVERVELDEILTTINKYLPIDMRADYLRMLDDVYVPKPRRIIIEHKIIDILAEHGHEIPTRD